MDAERRLSPQIGVQDGVEKIPQDLADHRPVGLLLRPEDVGIDVGIAVRDQDEGTAICLINSPQSRGGSMVHPS